VFRTEWPSFNRRTTSACFPDKLILGLPGSLLSSAVDTLPSCFRDPGTNPLHGQFFLGTGVLCEECRTSALPWGSSFRSPAVCQPAD
jgi:hypothetical protein